MTPKAAHRRLTISSQIVCSLSLSLSHHSIDADNRSTTDHRRRHLSPSPPTPPHRRLVSWRGLVVEPYWPAYEREVWVQVLRFKERYIVWAFCVFGQTPTQTTERFEAVYPTLKEIALTGSRGSKGMRQTTQQILQFAVKAAGEGVVDLSKEASIVIIWCLTTVTAYKQWNEKALPLRTMLYAWPPSGMHKSTAMCSWDNYRETMDALRSVGSGGNPLFGEQAAEESKQAIAVSLRL